MRNIHSFSLLQILILTYSLCWESHFFFTLKSLLPLTLFSGMWVIGSMCPWVLWEFVGWKTRNPKFYLSACQISPFVCVRCKSNFQFCKQQTKFLRSKVSHVPWTTTIAKKKKKTLFHHSRTQKSEAPCTYMKNWSSAKRVGAPILDSFVHWKIKDTQQKF